MPSRFYVRLIQLMILVQAVGLTGCKDSPVQPTPVITPVASIDLEPAEPVMARGQQLQLAAIPKSATGQALSDRPVLWVSLDPTVVSVTPQGLATALSEATARLQVTAGGLTRDVAIEVGAPAIASLTLDSTLLSIQEDGEAQLAVTVRNALGEVLPTARVHWASLSDQIASVSDGRVTANREGSTVIRASVGDIFVQALVHVTPNFGGDLVFVSADGPFGAKRMYRVDPGNFASKRALFDDNGNWNPAISPDGQRITWTCVAAGPGICVADLDGGNYRRLTDSDFNYEDQPSWSPDGQRIAFRRMRQIGTPGPWNPTDIWVMDADGSNQVNLTADASSQHWPQWSPTKVLGEYRIAFVQDSLVNGYETSRIALMREDGSERRYVTMGLGHVDIRPQWTPDATSLVFSRIGGPYSNAMLVVNVKSGDEWNLLEQTLPAGGQFHPVLSPNGRYVVFASQHEEVDGGFVPQIYTARADGTDVRRRSSGAHGKGEFSWIKRP